MKHKAERSREEQLAGDVLALVERFHVPAAHDHPHAHARQTESRHVVRGAVPAAVEALALLSLAHSLRTRHQRSDRRHGRAARFRRGMRRAIVLRHS